MTPEQLHSHETTESLDTKFEGIDADDVDVNHLLPPEDEDWTRPKIDSYENFESSYDTSEESNEAAPEDEDGTGLFL